jgi:formamidopyrimidine-DNA glycosylase
VLMGAALRVSSIGPHDMRARGAGRGERTTRGHGWIDSHALLDGARIVDVMRHGKRLGLVAQDGRALVIQFGMSGQLVIGKSAAESHRHVTWIVRPRSGQALPMVFRDPRRFGGVVPCTSVRAMVDAWHAELGPDGLLLRPGELMRRLIGERAVKAALLDQGVVAGVGNIYADEALHRAGIDPRTPCDRLNAPAIERLARSIRTVLRTAVRSGGSTLRDYINGNGRPGQAQLLHAVYGRSGEPCLACGRTLRLARLAGRATVWCPACQPSVHTRSGEHRALGRAAASHKCSVPRGRTERFG